MGMPFHDEQLRFMVQMADHRPDWLKPVLVALNYFDTPWFYFALIPTLWLGVSWKWGVRIFYWCSFNSLINALAKELVGWPRPCHEGAGAGLLSFGSYGFPSGGAQGSLFLAILLATYWKHRAAKWIALAYTLTISASRVGLGAHYPIDVLGGWAIGGLLGWLYVSKEKTIEEWLQKKGAAFCLILSVALPALLSLLAPGSGYIAGAMIGIGLGIYLSLRYRLFLPPAKSAAQGIRRAVIGVSAVFGMVLLWPVYLFQSFGVALLTSAAVSPFCKWIDPSIVRSSLWFRALFRYSRSGQRRR
jgi:membrane-associated phospholipid phosphatase